LQRGLGANPEKVLKNILVARAFNSDHQILLLEKVSEMIKAGEPIKLMIIDSLTAHFRAEFAGRGQLADRQQKLNRYMHDLMKLAEQHNLVVLCLQIKLWQILLKCLGTRQPRLEDILLDTQAHTDFIFEEENKVRVLQN